MMNTLCVAVPPAPTFTGGNTATQLRLRYAGTRVLLTDDDPIAREIMCYFLEDVGLVVEMASNGQQAVELARHNEYDLILMDLQMPELDGIAATRAIRNTGANSQNRRTPILAMTATAIDEDWQFCIDTGMNGLIAKPVRIDTLYETLLACLSRAALD